MQVLRLLVLCALVGVGAVVWAGGGRLYVNPRFGVAALTPKGWRAGPEPENGDGRMFTSPDGAASLAIYGSYRNSPVGEDMARLAQAGDGETVTYQKRGKKFVVVSGLRDGKVFYRKSLLSCGDGVWNSMTLTYPAVQKAQYDALTARIAASLHGEAVACD
jgi:serine/threonine-protein kinase